MVTLPGSSGKDLLALTTSLECLAPLMEPVGGGTYIYETRAPPEGTYELKVAVGGSWDENYG